MTISVIRVWRSQLEERSLRLAQVGCSRRFDRRELDDLAGDDDRDLAGGSRLCQCGRAELVAERPVEKDGVGPDQEERRVVEGRRRVRVLDQVDVQALAPELLRERPALADRLRDGADRPGGRRMQQRLAHSRRGGMSQDHAAVETLLQLDRDRESGAATPLEESLSLLADQPAQVFELEKTVRARRGQDAAGRARDRARLRGVSRTALGSPRRDFRPARRSTLPVPCSLREGSRRRVVPSSLLHARGRCEAPRPWRQAPTCRKFKGIWLGASERPWPQERSWTAEPAEPARPFWSAPPSRRLSRAS